MKATKKIRNPKKLPFVNRSSRSFKSSKVNSMQFVLWNIRGKSVRVIQDMTILLHLCQRSKLESNDEGFRSFPLMNTIFLGRKSAFHRSSPIVVVLISEGVYNKNITKVFARVKEIGALWILRRDFNDFGGGVTLLCGGWHRCFQRKMTFSHESEHVEGGDEKSCNIIVK